MRDSRLILLIAALLLSFATVAQQDASERLIGWLLEVGYPGAFELELLGPRIDEEGHAAAGARAATYTSELLTRLGA